MSTVLRRRSTVVSAVAALVLTSTAVPARSAPTISVVPPPPPPVATSEAATTNSAAGAATAPARRTKVRVRVSDTSPTVGEKIRISTRGSKARGGVRKLVVTFGDGRRVVRHRAVVTLKHRYRTAGTFTVKAVLVDRSGRRSAARKKVRVVAPEGPTFGGLAPREEITPETVPQASALPASADLTKYDMDVMHQSPSSHYPQIGSCVSWTVGYALMGWYHQRDRGRNVAFAPMYIYSQHHRAVENGVVGGMFVTEALDTLTSQGIDTAQHYGAGWAYDWQTKPNASQRQNASQYRITGHHALYAHKDGRGATAAEQEQVKAALAAQKPVAIAMTLKKDFDSYRSGVYRATGVATGRHAMLALGYDAQGLWVQNSWGTAWGVNGYVRIGWDAVAKDLYEAHVIEGLATTSTQDTTPPTATAPTMKVSAGTTMNNVGLPVTFSWSGKDDRGAVSGYSLMARTNGGEWTRQTLAQNATSVTFSLTPGNRYQFAVAAWDAAGNWSSWATGREFTVTAYDDASQYVGYQGSWHRLAWTDAWSGGMTSSSVAGATASFTFVGSNVGWIATAAPNRGQAEIYVDGTYVTTIDLYRAQTVSRFVALHGNWSANERHTLTVRVVGTPGRPTVDIDAFVLLY